VHITASRLAALIRATRQTGAAIWASSYVASADGAADDELLDLDLEAGHCDLRRCLAEHV
jgi:hypothetical protein